MQRGKKRQKLRVFNSSRGRDLRIRDLLYVLSSIWYEDSNRGQRLRRVLFFFGWQLWKRSVARSLTARLFNGLLIRVWPDCDSSPAAFYYSLPNSRHLSVVRNCLKGGTFVDVGANVGLVTLLVADKIGHAVLFEPNPSAFIRAQENLKMNGLSFEVVPIALSDKIGTVEFENLGASSCNRTVDGFATSVPTITVRCTTFDDFLRERSTPLPPIDAVKIDVEGYENSVLRGMKEFLRRQRPKIVMFEYLARTDILQTLAIFHEVGYSVFELSPSGTRRIADDEVKPLQDLFACPDENANELGI
jgi:FkbM family methyltransferase